MDFTFYVNQFYFVVVAEFRNVFRTRTAYGISVFRSHDCLLLLLFFLPVPGGSSSETKLVVVVVALVKRIRLQLVERWNFLQPSCVYSVRCFFLFNKYITMTFTTLSLWKKILFFFARPEYCGVVVCCRRIIFFYFFE